MSAVNDILREIPISQLAQQLGTDEQTAQQAVAQAVPMLISGMQNNAQDPGGEQALAGALDDHAMRGLLDGGVDLNQVDTADGEKIVSHIFSDPSQMNALAGQYGFGGGQGSLMQRLLPLLAPIVLAYIGRQLQGRAGQGGGSGSILGDLLGGALGGGLGGGQAGYPQPRSSQGGILGDLLGGMLGGGAGGMLGGMLGGGAQAPAAQQYQQEQYEQPGFGGQQGGFGFPSQQAEEGLGIPMPDSNDSGTGGFGPGYTEQRAPQQEERQSDGGILGDILGGMFGGDRKR